MLGYLDALIAALAVRDSSEVQRLLAHPLARLLPEDVIAEATAIAGGARDALAAPLRALQLRYQTAELLRDAPLSADQRESADEPNRSAVAMSPPVPSSVTRSRRAARPQQMELPLSA